MTTTAATTNTSASTSTPPKDSPELHDYDANDNDDDDEDEDGTSKSIVEQQRKQEHNHIEQKCQNLEQSPSPQQSTPPQPQPPSQDRPPTPSQLQSTEVDVSNTSTPNANLITTASPNQTTISSTPANVADTQNDHQLEQSTSSQQQQPHQQPTNNSNNNIEQKRPMNAFLLFCKRQRSLVKEKYPNLENRGITKILGDWWSKLDKEQKSKYTDLARQHTEAFMKANPDFKWCKTPNVSNINNNITITDADHEGCNNSVTNQQQQKQSNNLQRLQQNNRHPSTAANAELMSSQPIHHPMEIVYHSSNSMDIMLKSKQQLEAPKPPKKRFLERNDSVFTRKSSYGPNQNDANSHGTDGPVPYSLDQDSLNKVIDSAFSQDSSSSPSGVNSCKSSNRNTTSLTTSCNNQTSFSSSSTSTNYATNTDEPVDFSMNKTISATSQQIIDSLVDIMLKGGPDNSSSFSKMNGTDSVRPQIRPPVKRDNPDDT